MVLTKILLSMFMFTCCSYKVFVASGSYCLFLVILSMSSSLLLFSVTNSFWYCSLLLLVYMGGVYVLLLFVSMYSYKSHSYGKVSNALFMSGSFIMFFYMKLYNDLDMNFTKNELFKKMNDESLNILSKSKWVSYMFILMIMLVSMMMFSYMFKDSSNYMR